MDARSISDRRKWKGGAGALVLALLCVLAVALLQRHGWFDGLNIGSMRLAGEARQSQVGRGVTPVMIAASLLGDTAGRAVVAVLAAIALSFAGRARQGLWLIIVAGVGTALNTGLKQIFAAPRPDLLPHLDIVHSFSFPSGHSAGAMILFGGLALISGRRWTYVLGGAGVALIGVSRIWLGVHWPSDVLAGWIVGVGWLGFCRPWLPPREERHRQ